MPDVAFAVAVSSGVFAGRTHISSSCKPSEDTSTTSDELSAIVELAVGVLSTSESLSIILLRRGVWSCVEVDTIDFALELLVSACSASVDVGGDVR